ncbi:MAG: hypothetical protein LC793_10635, partial [Thermomicrobia bacterium]|nr:hypothetical protein [Thermomicrobia bacterium]
LNTGRVGTGGAGGNGANGGTGGAGGNANGGAIAYGAGSGTFRVLNSTLSGNSAAAANGSAGGLAGLAGVGGTIGTVPSGPNGMPGNPGVVGGLGIPAGGGIAGNGLITVTIANTIVVNSSRGNCAGVLANNGGHNIEFGAGGSCGTTFIASNPNLSALTNNGGPTQTMAIIPGSPAFAVGDPLVCAAAPPNGAGGVDQRGFPRSANRCSIGAFEPQTMPLPPPKPTGAPLLPTSNPLPVPRPSGVPITAATPLPIPPGRP